MIPFTKDELSDIPDGPEPTFFSRLPLGTKFRFAGFEDMEPFYVKSGPCAAEYYRNDGDSGAPRRFLFISPGDQVVAL